MKHYDVELKYQTKLRKGKLEFWTTDIEAKSINDAINIAIKRLIKYYYDWFLLKIKTSDVNITEVKCERRSRW